jgi:hypothetical protein
MLAVSIYGKLKLENAEKALELCKELCELLEDGDGNVFTIGENQDFETYKDFKKNMADKLIK